MLQSIKRVGLEAVRVCVLISRHVHKTDHEIVKVKARAFRVREDDLAWSV